MQVIEGGEWAAAQEQEQYFAETAAGAKHAIAGTKSMSGTLCRRGLAGVVGERVGIVLLGRYNVVFQAIIRLAPHEHFGVEVEWISAGEWWPKFKAKRITGKRCLIFVDDNSEVAA